MLAVILSGETMNENPIIFEEQGHPTIKVFDDKISIKAKDYSNYRDFKLDKIKSLEFYRPYENSLLGILYGLHPFLKKYRDKDDYVLRIKLKDGNYWDYETTYKYNPNFKTLIESLQSRLLTK